MRGTTVNVHDGETVVIGGIIRTRDDHRETKVPWFGDLPVIGNLFKATQDTAEEAELLIILTPKVIEGIADARRVSEFERDLTGLLPKEVLRSPLMGSLRVPPTDNDSAADGDANESEYDSQMLFDKPAKL